MDPSNPANLLISGIYYVLIGLTTFFSMFGVYILIRYGRTKSLTVSIAVIYAIFFLKILAESYATLHTLIS